MIATASSFLKIASIAGLLACAVIHAKQHNFSDDVIMAGPRGLFDDNQPSAAEGPPQKPKKMMS